jgi:ribosomal protein L21E
MKSYKVGDKVRMCFDNEQQATNLERRFETQNPGYVKCGMVSSMLDFAGRVVTISKIYVNGNEFNYYIKEDCGSFKWGHCWMELVARRQDQIELYKVGDKVRIRFNSEQQAKEMEDKFKKRNPFCYTSGILEFADKVVTIRKVFEEDFYYEIEEDHGYFVWSHCWMEPVVTKGGNVGPDIAYDPTWDRNSSNVVGELRKLSEQKKSNNLNKFQKKEEEVSKNTAKGSLKGVTDMLTSGARDGFSIAASTEASEFIVEAAHKLLGKYKPSWVEFLEGIPILRSVEALVIASVVKFVCGVYKIPHSSKAEKITSLVVVGQFERLATPVILHVKKLAEEIAKHNFLLDDDDGSSE